MSALSNFQDAHWEKMWTSGEGLELKDAVAMNKYFGLAYT